MYDAAECVFLYLETSARVGGGEATKAVDLSLQRESATGYPMLPASSLKGTLRGRARRQQAPEERLRLLGSEPDSEVKQASGLILSDALPLLFPIRSLTGLFAWATSINVWQRFQRDLDAYGVKMANLPQLPAFPAETAGVAVGSPLLTSKQTLVLEEMSFAAQPCEEAASLGAWLADQCLPDEKAFVYWQERMARNVVVLPEGAYRYFLEHATQVVPRIRIDPRTGTAAEGALWTEEFLPPETLMYALVGVQFPEAPAVADSPVAYITGDFKKPADALAWVKGLAPTRFQIGAGQTLGRGIVRVRWTGKKPARPAAPRKSRKSG